MKQAVAKQKALLAKAWESRSEAAKVKTPYEALTLASIIEKETGLATDRHLVSSVFNNRLSIGMPLQTDPTVIYGLGEKFSGNITRKDLQTPTPYNTYVIPALPPTPIAAPTWASIEAAVNPAEPRRTQPRRQAVHPEPPEDAEEGQAQGTATYEGNSTMNCNANACTTADAGDDAGRFALTTTAPCCRVTEYGLMRVSGKASLRTPSRASPTKSAMRATAPRRAAFSPRSASGWTATTS